MSEYDNLQKEIVKVLDNGDTPMTQKSIREKIGCPKSTLSKKLSCLEDNSVVEDVSSFHEKRNGYRLENGVSLTKSVKYKQFLDTQSLIFVIQTIGFGAITLAVIDRFNVTRNMAFMMYLSFLMGVIPPIIMFFLNVIDEDNFRELQVVESNSS